MNFDDDNNDKCSHWDCPYHTCRYHENCVDGEEEERYYFPTTIEEMQECHNSYDL